MSIPRPAGPYSDEILGDNWPATDPDSLSQIAIHTTADGHRIRDAADEMLGVGAGVLDHNEGAGPEAMSRQVRQDALGWEDLGEAFVKTGTLLDIMAWTVRGCQTQMTTVVTETQAAIATIKAEAEAAALSAPMAAVATQAQSETLITEAVAAAVTEVSTVSAYVAGHIAAMAGDIPAATSTVGPGGGIAVPGASGNGIPGSDASTHGGWTTGTSSTSTLTGGGPASDSTDSLVSQTTHGSGSKQLTKNVDYQPQTEAGKGQLPPERTQPGGQTTAGGDPPKALAQPVPGSGSPGLSTPGTSASIPTGGDGKLGASSGRGGGAVEGGPNATSTAGRDLTGAGSRAGGATMNGSGGPGSTQESSTTGFRGVTAQIPERGGFGNSGVRLSTNGFGASPMMSPGGAALGQSGYAPSVPTTDSTPLLPRGGGVSEFHGSGTGVAPTVHSGADLRPAVGDPAGTVAARSPTFPSVQGSTGGGPQGPTAGPASVQPMNAPVQTQSVEAPIIPPAAAAAAATAPAAIRDGAAAAFIAAGPVSGLIAAPVNVDLVQAKTLLAGILAAPGALVTEWAVGALRGGVIGAPSYVVTSGRGRGWIPASLFLPVEVESPWHGHTAHDSRQWEGLADPSRIIAEYATIMGKRYGTQLMAVAASKPSGLRNSLPDDAAFEFNSDPDLTIDLTVQTPVSMHRLQLSCPDMVDEIAAVVDPADIAAECLGLAWDAAARTPSFEVTSPSGRTSAELRQSILQAIHNRTPVDDTWWAELTTADVLLDEAARACRLNPSPTVAYGALPEVADRTYALISAESAANEAVLLLRDQTDLSLPDVYYAYRALLDLLSLDQR